MTIRATTIRSRKPGERQRNRFHYLFPPPLSITRPGCHCYAPPPINGSSLPFLFSFFFFFFFFLPPPWWLLSFYTIVVSSSHVSFFSISLPLSLSRSIREARGRASRPGTSRFISIRGSTTNDHRVLLRSPTPIDDLFVRRDIRESGFFRMRMELAGYRGSPRIAPRGLLQLAKMDLLIPFV